MRVKEKEFEIVSIHFMGDPAFSRIQERLTGILPVGRAFPSTRDRQDAGPTEPAGDRQFAP